MAAITFTAPSWVTSFATVLVGVLTAIYLFLWGHLFLTRDAREPPLAPGLIPYISPIIGMKRMKSSFYTYMKDKYSQPIYTLRLPGSRVYVINSTALIPAVQRQYRTLSFDPLQIKGCETILGVSQTALDIIGRDVTAGDSNTFLSRLIKHIYPSLSTGPALNAMNSRAFQSLETSLTQLARDGPKAALMYDFIRKTIMDATTDSVFGPLNPIRKPENLAAWIKFESKIPLLTLGALPDWALKEGIEARKVLVHAFDCYFDEKGQEQASGFIQGRFEYFTQEGIPSKDISRFEIGNLIALSSNTIPTAFWLIYHIFSDPDILEDCRAEVSSAIQQQQDGTSKINFDQIRNSCPILQSTFWEVFRTHGIGLVPRRALEDHLLDNQYLIKKGGTIFIPYRVQHQDSAIWGDNKADFYHKRFIKQQGTKRHNPAAFRGFGGGAHLCPGRHFVSAELLLFATMMIMRFDVVPVGGPWPKIPVEKSSQVSALDQPDHDVEVEFRPRQGNNQQCWTIDFSGLERGMDMPS